MDKNKMNELKVGDIVKVTHRPSDALFLGWVGAMDKEVGNELEITDLHEDCATLKTHDNEWNFPFEGLEKKKVAPKIRREMIRRVREINSKKQLEKQ